MGGTFLCLKRRRSGGAIALEGAEETAEPAGGGDGFQGEEEGGAALVGEGKGGGRGVAVEKGDEVEEGDDPRDGEGGIERDTDVAEARMGQGGGEDPSDDAHRLPLYDAEKARGVFEVGGGVLEGVGKLEAGAEEREEEAGAADKLRKAVEEEGLPEEWAGGHGGVEVVNL